MMKSIIDRIFSIKALVALMIICATGSAWAVDKVNPVTGETESYSNIFTGGTDSEWNKAANWTLATESKVPFVSSGDYNAALVDGKMAPSASTAIDGWQLRVGAYNGATVTWSSGITKIQASNTGCWLTADETSSITIASFGNKQLEGSDTYPFKLSSAKAGGITWSAGLTSASNTSLPFWYYLKGTGTVVYSGDITVANAQVIKQADITLSGTSRVASKTLVTFGSGTTKSFTADATIKRLNSSGTDLGNNALVATVNTTGTATLTTADAVGTCELVQTSTGIKLYWVDGDPADLPAPTVYKPSININFASGAANGLTTSADVGLGGYAIPGTSWNNLAVANNASLSDLKAADSSGSTFATAASVTLTGTRGYHSCSALPAASDLRHGYIDENDGNPTPTVTVSGIPYEKYRVIVYTATDTPSTAFGYITVNGKNYTYVSDALAEGTTAWGASGAQDTAEPMAEGVNVLVSPVTLGSTLTVVGHRGTGARGCIAAIQIVEYVPEITENDLAILVVGASATYTVSEAKTLSGTVYLGGNGTLTLDGSAKITAATIDVAKDVILNINADRLDATTFTGLGTVVYEGKKPASGKGWTDNSAWKGTVWVKNIPADNNERKDWDPALYGNADSTLRFTNVNLYFPNNTTTAFPGTIDLDGAGMNICDGYGGSIATIARLTGSGTLSTTGGSSSGNGLTINDASGFTGTITLTKYKVIVGTSTGTSASGVLQIESGKSITVAGATAPDGFVINGTLVANGTLASSASPAVSGAGTIVFTGRAPTVSGDAWWKNADWRGTVQVKDVTNMVGDNRAGTWLQFNEYGNSNSVVEMNNVTGWLPIGYTCTPKIKVTGSLYLNNGGSNKANAFKVGTLLGSGTISGDGSAPTVVFNVTDDWSGFTGTLALNNKCIVFGKTIPDTLTQGTIYVSEGAVVTPQQSSGVWWGVGGIKVDGELRAPNLGKFGGGTTITTSDTGVFTLLTASQIDDQSTSYARITGTGTLRYADGGGNNWRTLSQTDFPTGMICENNISAGLILKTAGGNHTIGSLAGSGKVRSDWGSGNRNLRILQAKDTTYSGLFDTDDRVGTVTVASGTSTAGTLTLTGVQTVSNDLSVESGAKVKVTGTWKGATTVAGSLAFGGAGKVDGGVTTSDGSTLDYTDATGTDHITGALTLNAGTTIKFPNGAKFPYKLAGSITYDGIEIAAAKYTVGGMAGTVPLTVDKAKGEAYIVVSKEFSSDSDWATLGLDVSPAAGADCTITVRESGTLTLGTATAGTVTINVPSGKALTLTGTLTATTINITGEGKVICLQNNTLQGTITGSGTLQYTEKVAPDVTTANAKAVFTDTRWTGTLVIVNCGYLNVDSTDRTRTPFELYGNENSKIKAPGFKGYAAVVGLEVDDKVCQAELVIDAPNVVDGVDVNQVEFNHGWRDSDEDGVDDTPDIYPEGDDAGFRFVKISGTGSLKLDGTTDYAQYIFHDVRNFEGSVHITRPDSGGRKSFLFGVDADWPITGSEYPANLVIASNVTVAENKQWTIPAGIILRDNATLTLSNGSTISHLSPASVGTLAVAENAIATLGNVQGAVISTKLNIDSDSTLQITDTALTKLTIPADATANTGTYVNDGTLNLSGCTSLTTLQLVLGSSTGFADLNDTSKLTLPGTCKTIVYDVGTVRNLDGYNMPSWSGDGKVFYYQATETIAEYSAKEETNAFTMTNVPTGAKVMLDRYNGATVEAVPPSEGSNQRVYWKGSVFSGAACWHEWDFEQDTPANTLNDSGVATSADPGGVSAVSLVATHEASSIAYIDAGTETKRYIPSSEHPYPASALAFGDNWSAAVRCKMPSGNNKVAVAFGDKANGILGLATGGQADVVELFNWTSENGGKYTTLAQLMVESASTAMHIYVLAVETVSSTKYVMLYRDGELIHTAEFNLNTAESAITTFKIGDVIGERTEGDKLPGSAEDDNGTTSVDEAGYVDYVRLYNKTVDSSIAEGLSARRPFVSAIDLFERELTSLTPENWSANDAWVKTAGTSGIKANANAPTPNGDPAVNVSVTMANGSSLDMNLTSDAAYGTLIFNGSEEAAASIRQSNAGRIAANMLVVRRGLDLTVDWDAVGRSEGPAFTVAGVDSGAKLTFDFTDYFTVNEVRETTVITLIGNVPACAYDDSADDRIEVLMPETLPAYIQSAAGGWDTTTPGVYAYKVTITPDHTPGVNDIYYKEGYITAGMDGNGGANIGKVFSNPELTEKTTLLEGDTMVISDTSALNAESKAWISDKFNGNIKVTRTTLNLMPGEDNSGILNNRTITVESDKVLNLKAQGARMFNFGNLTLNGTGNINFVDDATVASLSGNANITVASDVTLTLASLSGTFTGSILGTGTVKLPDIVDGDTFNFDAYGNSGSTVELTSFIGTVANSVTTTLKLDGAMSISSLTGGAPYLFARVSGAGDLTFPANATPTSITVAELVDYSGTINNGNTTAVTITKLIKSGVYHGGDVLLTKDGSGSVVVSAVEIGGIAKQGDWDDNDFYLVAAEYNRQNYKSVAAAISAAGDENIGGITVFDTLETLPAGYRYVEGETTTVAKRPFALVVSGTPAYYDVARDVVIAAALASPPYGSGYDYIDVRVGGNVDIPLLANGLKIKNTGGADINFTELSDEYEPNPVEDDGYITYNFTEKPTIYTWTGAAFDTITGDSDPRWEAIGNWSYVDSASKTQTASRQPQAGDTVVFNSAAEGVTIGSNTSVAAIRVGAAVSISKARSSAVTLTATTENGIVLTDKDATITVSGVTLSPTPTTSLDYYEVVESDGTYSVNKLAEADTATIGEGDDAETITVITPTSGTTIVVPDSVNTKVAIPGTVTNITGVEVDDLLLKVEYDNGAQTEYYAGILSLDGSGNVSLDGTKSVTVGGVDIPVKPACNESVTVDEQTLAPMSLNNEGNPMFAFKTIPGLWYVVETSTDGSNYEAGTATQATDNATAISAALPGAGQTVLYYRVGVGASKASAEDEQ